MEEAISLIDKERERTSELEPEEDHLPKAISLPPVNPSLSLSLHYFFLAGKTKLSPISKSLHKVDTFLPLKKRRRRKEEEEEEREKIVWGRYNI